MSALLNVRDLTIANGTREIARGITFSLAPGEAVAVLGPNGAGKTTLLRTLLGLIPFSVGSITLSGAALHGLTPSARAGRLAYVPQVSRLPHDFCVRDVVLMARLNHHAWYSQPSEKDGLAAHHALTQMGVVELATRTFSTLSGGEQQMVLIARALAGEAPILVLDEPVASLDFRHQHTLLTHLAALKNQGKAILFSTHHPEHAARLADTVVSIASNGAAFAGVAADMLTAKNLSALYGIELAATRGESGALFVAPQL